MRRKCNDLILIVRNVLSEGSSIPASPPCATECNEELPASIRTLEETYYERRYNAEYDRLKHIHIRINHHISLLTLVGGALVYLMRNSYHLPSWGLWIFFWTLAVLAVAPLIWAISKLLGNLIEGLIEGYKYAYPSTPLEILHTYAAQVEAFRTKYGYTRPRAKSAATSYLKKVRDAQ